MKAFFSLLFFLSSRLAVGQELPQNLQVQVEEFTMVNESEPEDDQWLLEMEELLRHPLNLRTADADELQRLRLLSAVQVHSFLQYRAMLGAPGSVYELQAIPGWTPELIRKLLPYVRIGATGNDKEFGQRITGGRHEMLSRAVIIPQLSKGFMDGKFEGSPLKLLTRYRYQYQQLLQWGITLEKDSGEKLWRGNRGTGVDFFSSHLVIRKWKAIETLVLGDFTVNLGQGLTQWQSFSFGRGAEISQVRRQGAAFRPYTSTGENQFMRGLAIALKKGRWSSGVFFSKNKTDANISVDPFTGESVITSLQTSGLHRTANERADRRSAGLLSTGGFSRWNFAHTGFGMHFVYHHFDKPFRRKSEPYNIFYLEGKSSGNVGIEFFHTSRNMHMFGEAASDIRRNFAFVGGLMIHLDRKVDAGIVLRGLSSAYETLFGNTFSVSSQPHNEQGIYFALTGRPAQGWKIDFFADLYRFPWLRYRVDGPSLGKEISLQGEYVPTKRFSLLTRLRLRFSEANASGPDRAPGILENRQVNWRTHFSFTVAPGIQIRARFEHNYVLPAREEGFLFFTDCVFRPLEKKWSGSLRLSVFETGGYDSRIYAFENSVLYGFAIPAFSGRGTRYYLNAEYELTRHIKTWLRWAVTRYYDRNSIGSGDDQVQGDSRSEFILQVRVRI